MQRLPFAALLLVSLAGCQPTYGVGHVDVRGFTHETYPMRVRAAERGVLLSESWRVTSHTPSGRVRPDHFHVRRLDRDADGRVDVSYRAAINELALEHRGDGSSLWVQSFILPSGLEGAPIERIATAFVEGLSGEERVVWSYGGARGFSWSTDRYDASLLDQAAMAVDGNAAHMALVEVQRTSAASVGRARAALTFVRAPFTWRETQRGGASREWPVVVVVGYAADDANFGTHWDDYAALVGALELGDPHVRRALASARTRGGDTARASTRQNESVDAQVDEPVDETGGAGDSEPPSESGAVEATPLTAEVER